MSASLAITFLNKISEMLEHRPLPLGGFNATQEVLHVYIEKTTVK